MKYAIWEMVLLVTIVVGCGDNTANCPVGSEGCPCTAGGACDDGLVCLSRLCVNPGADADADADADGDAADADANTDADVDADGVGEADGAADADADGDADACVPDFCTSRECGDDTCGGLCGPGCGSIETCSAAGHCVPASTTWVEIPPGTFQMGAPFSELGRSPVETPHQVTLTREFGMQATEVTQTEYQALMGSNPSTRAGCDSCPVETATRTEAMHFCNALSRSAGRPECYYCPSAVSCALDWTVYANPYDCPGYRLPTEAEWEYAARAGTITATHNGDTDATHLGCEAPNPVADPIAWFCANTTTTRNVGLKLPNSWGLYDMLGNVNEWTDDTMDGDYSPDPVVDPWSTAGRYYMTRGGSFMVNGSAVRSAYRAGMGSTGDRSSTLGFRPVRSLP